MKYLIWACLLVISTADATAQKHNFFGDISVNYPGASFTYNYKTTKHLGIGAGIQGAYRDFTDWNMHTTRLFTPAIYVDLRAYTPIRKRSLIFYTMDLGMNFYKRTSGSSRNELPHNNGFYMGLGVGYSYRIIRWGIAPYVSFRLASDTYVAKEIDPVTNKTARLFSLDAMPLLSLGVKF